jgi:hypothetical protein
MQSIHPSDPTEQRLTEIEVLSLLNKKLKLTLISKSIVVNNILFQLDGYSEKPPVLCEIYSRIGRLKPSQKNKITKDILKMLLIEKIKRKKFRKVIAFTDIEVARCFDFGTSWYSKLKDYFGIEIILVEISPSRRKNLIKAQKKQYR